MHQEIQRHIEFLARHPRSYQDKWYSECQDYIIKQLNSHNIQTQKIPIRYTPEEGQAYRNIISSINPGARKRIVLGAHYGSVVNGPGADDNASGVGVLLALHSRVKDLKISSYGIDFVFFGLEEPPYFRLGSKVHAYKIKAAPEDIFFINVDSVGVFSEEKGSQISSHCVDYPDTANFLEISASVNHNEALLLKLVSSFTHLRVITHYNNQESDYMISLTDNHNYSEYGYDSVLVTDTCTSRKPCQYHLPTDTIDTLNFEYINCLLIEMMKFFESLTVEKRSVTRE